MAYRLTSSILCISLSFYLHYTATAGYDNASGIGTPDAWNIARDLAGSSTGPTPTPTPTPPPTGTPTPTPTPPPTGGTSQLLLNPGFESGATSWTESSTGGYQIVDPTRPHTGADSAYLGGYHSGTDSIYQTVALPASTSKVVLTYWVYISTQETSTTAYDNFVARLRTSTGATISTPQTLSNRNASGWTQYSFDVTSVLASHVGQSIEVYFSETTDSTLTTSFFVDDVALNVTH